MSRPVLIVGGGPAGSAAAIALARGGQSPLLIERAPAGRNVVCGGFLGWDALAALRRLGIDVAALGAHPIARVRLVRGDRAVEADLPHPAAGLSRPRLDAALLEAAEAAGVSVRRGRAVRAIDPAGLRVRIGEDAEQACEAIFLAAGKHDLRGLRRAAAAPRGGLAVGLRATLPASAEREGSLAGVVELHLFKDGYAGLLLQEDGTANLCLSVSEDRFRAAGGPLGVLPAIVSEAPLLGSRIGADAPAGFDAVAGVPYGWRARATFPGLFRIGDQAAVIASLAGDGIAIALASGEDAARAMLARGPDAAPDWQRAFACRVRAPIGLAELLRKGLAQPKAAVAMMGLAAHLPTLVRGAARLTRT